MTDEFNFPVLPDRPYVIYNAAMTIDGKIATISGDSSLSDEKDWHDVHTLRSKVDGIMVGIGTILEDDAKLTIRYLSNLDHYPVRIVIDSHLRIPINARVIQEKKGDYSTIIATISNQNISKRHYRDKLIKEGVTILESPSQKHVDLAWLVASLKKMGIHSILLEGGGTLAWGMLQMKLIDELRIFIAPVLTGGIQATSLIMGEGFSKIQKSPHFSLLSVNTRQDFVVLRYRCI